MTILDGKKIAAQYHEVLKARIMDMRKRPALAVILVGDNYASHLYVALKEKAAKKIGIDFHKYLFDAHTTQEELIENIAFLRDDEAIDGMIVQLPLPEGFDTDAVIAALGKEKDADGFHPDNIQAFADGGGDREPVFPKAMLALAEESQQDLVGKQVVILGHSDVFLTAMVAMCTRARMIVYHVQDDHIAQHKELLLASDVIFTAMGKPHALTGEYVKNGAIVVDGGISSLEGKTVGDVDMDSVEEKARYISPVPGGVGPVTIACLLENVVDLAHKKQL